MSVRWTQDPGTYAMMERYIRKMTLEPIMQVDCFHTAVIARGCWFSKEIPPFDLFEQQFFLFFSSFHTIHCWPCLTLKLKPQDPVLQLMWRLAFKGRSLSLRFVPPGRFCYLLCWVFREPIAKRFLLFWKVLSFRCRKSRKIDSVIRGLMKINSISWITNILLPLKCSSLGSYWVDGVMSR